jgi:hypothetical protein
MTLFRGNRLQMEPHLLIYLTQMKLPKVKRQSAVLLVDQVVPMVGRRNSD